MRMSKVGHVACIRSISNAHRVLVHKSKKRRLSGNAKDMGQNSIIHRPVLYLKLNYIGSSVLHRKEITSPLRAQLVNTIYRFVTMVY
jgi:hypothetical protein